MLSPVPRVVETATPEAQTVRLGRDSVLELAMVAFADGAPRAVRFSKMQIEAMAMLANHGLDWARLAPRLTADAFRVDASTRIGKAWLNAQVALTPNEQGGFPGIGLRLGHVPIPDAVVHAAADALAAFGRSRGLAVPPVETMVSRFDVEASGVSATLAVPRDFFRLGRTLVAPRRQTVDPRLVHRIYGVLMAQELRRPPRSLADAMRIAFAARPDGDAAAANRAALVALAMFVVDPAARRLADAGAGQAAPCKPAPPYVTLAGRNDLAKHFILSAALGSTMGPQFTRAMGEWKELDDSLPGGSGFSFVDLAADRAGLAIGRAAGDEATADKLGRQLALAGEATIFPVRALGFAEGMSEDAFRARFGALDTTPYAQAVEQVDRTLRLLPLFRELAQASTEAR